jgi:hypothetical protein
MRVDTHIPLLSKPKLAPHDPLSAIVRQRVYRLWSEREAVSGLLWGRRVRR